MLLHACKCKSITLKLAFCVAAVIGGLDASGPSPEDLGAALDLALERDCTQPCRSRAAATYVRVPVRALPVISPFGPRRRRFGVVKSCS